MSHPAMCQQHNNEFITAIPAGDILSAHVPEQQIAHFTQDSITRSMTVNIVEVLKSSTSSIMMSRLSCLREARSSSRSRVSSRYRG